MHCVSPVQSMRIRVFVPRVSLAFAAFIQLAGSCAMAIDVPVTERCASLASADLGSNSEVPVMVRASTLVPSAGERPAYCAFEGAINEHVDLQLQLPIHDWNGNVLTLAYVSTAETCNQYLKRGYACMPVYRTFKKNRRDQDWAAARLQDSQVRLDASVAPHLLAVAGTEIVRRYYGQPVKKRYLMGCSAGGYHGMLEAQRFPWDYDGIVAGAPNLDTADWLVRALWHARNSRGADGEPILSADDLRLLHRSTLAACDLDDGVADAIVSNPLGCRVDLSRLVCKRNKRADCFSAEQVAAIERIYAGPALAVPELAGSQPNMLPASEVSWPEVKFDAWLSGILPAYFDLMFEGAHPKITPRNFDFERDYKQTSLAKWIAVDNPDLRRFKAAGGKMIAYLGGNDVAYVNGIIDYYETVERTMGGRAATQDFFRFFLVPGMNHCSGGDGPYAIDYLSYLEAWVEGGKAPDALIGAHPVTAPETLEFPLDPAMPVAFTRPIYPHPSYPKYKGSGDPNDASNFFPVNPRATPLARH